MTLTVYFDLICTDDVPLFSVLFDSKVQEFIAEGHGVRKISDLLSDDKDFELLSRIYGGNEAGAFFDHFGVQLPYFLGLAVTLSAGVEDSWEFNRFSRTGISEFDVYNSIEEGIVDYFSLVGKISLFVLAHAIV